LSTDVLEVRTASIINSSLMLEAVRTSETSVDNHFTWQYTPEDNSEHHTRSRENLKSHNIRCDALQSYTSGFHVGGDFQQNLKV
jgi:hypothetical protein